jgi:hypothetical protein
MCTTEIFRYYYPTTILHECEACLFARSSSSCFTTMHIMHIKQKNAPCALMQPLNHWHMQYCTPTMTTDMHYDIHYGYTSMTNNATTAATVTGIWVLPLLIHVHTLVSNTRISHCLLLLLVWWIMCALSYCPQLQRAQLEHESMCMGSHAYVPKHKASRHCASCE